MGKFTAAEEDVKVGAGDFKKAIRINAELTIGGQKTTITSWYAEKVGLVRQVVAANGQRFLLELDKFEEGK